MAPLLTALTALMVLLPLLQPVLLTCPPLMQAKCNCTLPATISCHGLTHSDWLAVAGLPEPVWTGLFVANSPDLGPRLDLAELSPGWRARLESLAIRTSDLRAVRAAGVWLPRLTALDLSANRFTELGDAVSQLGGSAVGNSSTASSLLSLLLGDNQFLELGDGSSLLGFQRLGLIDFSGCQELRRVTFGFTDSLAGLPALRQLRFNGCRWLEAWAWGPALRRLRALGGIGVKDTPAWNCSCESAWLAELAAPTGQHRPAACAHPRRLSGRPLSSVNFTREFGCRPPVFADFSGKARYAVGDTARLLCRVAAEPAASVTWTTNRAANVTFKPALRHSYVTPADTLANTFHADHQWHWDSQYDASQSREGLASGRIQVLQDASLYIDYVTRSDAGVYICEADNGIGPGPQSGKLEFTLRYEVLREVKKYGFIVGGACAASLLGIGFAIGLIRLVVRRCSEEERQRKQSIKDMLEHLESYREAKLEQFKEYKDWLRARGGVDGYNSRVARVKDACIANMSSMQESYNRRIAKVRDHCDSQIERLRESYNSQMGRIKDYRSSHVERVREQYNQQLVRIKDYAAAQLERLREQYKAQQASLIRMLESVSIDNCVSGGAGVDELGGLEFGELDSTSDSEDAAAPPDGESPPPESQRLRRLRKRRRRQLQEAEVAAATLPIDEEEESLVDFVTGPAASATVASSEGGGTDDQLSAEEDAAAGSGARAGPVTTEVWVEIQPRPSPPPPLHPVGAAAAADVS